MKTYQATIAALFAATTEARLWVGECPSIDFNTGFDSAAFAGLWYEQERDATFTFEMDQMCSTANYVMNSKGTLDASFRSMMPLNFYQYGSSPPGVLDCSESSDCKLTMNGGDNAASWGIIGTDYSNW